MFGAPTLADPDWEDCTWPNLFQPDEMAAYSNYDPVYTHTTQTYRFGKDPEIRMVIGSSWRRTFCPGEPQ